MAVYTQLGAEQLAELIGHFDVGDLVMAKGIAEGVSNSNWLVETTGKDGSGARFILTMYEYRIELEDLPFFLSLLDHLAARGCPVPRTIHDRSGALYRMVGDKAVALIDLWPNWPSNALILLGPPGSGKSHLAAVWHEMTGAILARVSDIRGEAVPGLLGKAALVVEDAPGEALDEAAFFHLLNLAREQKAYVLVTALTAPLAGDQR